MSSTPRTRKRPDELPHVVAFKAAIWDGAPAFIPADNPRQAYQQIYHWHRATDVDGFPRGALKCMSGGVKVDLEIYWKWLKCA